jgi:hypothetical protein
MSFFGEFLIGSYHLPALPPDVLYELALSHLRIRSHVFFLLSFGSTILVCLLNHSLMRLAYWLTGVPRTHEVYVVPRSVLSYYRLQKCRPAFT